MDKKEQIKNILQEYYTVAQEETMGFHFFGLNYKGSGRTIDEFIDKIINVFE
jgi:hypothetical protein